jgi:prepilin-type N-terminal cleavage/methylation domain-containing protein
LLAPAARRAPEGFTLIELMIVVAILGVLAAIAIPAFSTFMRRAKSVEAVEHLNYLYGHAATYFARSHAVAGVTGDQLAHCTVPSVDNQVTPRPDKQAGDFSAASFRPLGVREIISYYRYELDNVDASAGRCGVPAGTSALYQLRARGDLDGDGQQSLIELATGTTSENEMMHGRAFHFENESE